MASSIILNLKICNKPGKIIAARKHCATTGNLVFQLNEEHIKFWYFYFCVSVVCYLCYVWTNNSFKAISRVNDHTNFFDFVLGHI